MDKEELTKRVYEDLKSSKLKITKAEVSDIVTTVLNNMRNQIAVGGRVDIKSFGSFYSKLVKRRNISDNTFIKKWTIYFRPHKSLKEELNNNG